MGRNHLRVLSELDGISLVAAADADAASRDLAARRFNVPTYPGHEEMLE
ncbi:MAG: hypothetical protein ACRDG4_11895, partial [Chloroflexota bacterium]